LSWCGAPTYATALMFAPDSPVVSRVAASPNHGERRGLLAPDMLLLHYTGMQEAQEALARLCQPGSDVSAHYVVFEDGEIVQCVPEALRAWHAGEAFWAGATDINSRSIGIEIANPGHYWGYRDFPGPQVAAVIALARDIVARNRIRPERVLGHSDVAPARKEDPGEKFPWDRLAAAGVGLWVAPAPIGDDQPLAEGENGAHVRMLQQQLADHGYRIVATGAYDARTKDVVAAFQRHFRPARVDGLADESTRATLASLLAAR
jgi:N-acetylmuramoyl-L-alanine amidase